MSHLQGCSHGFFPCGDFFLFVNFSRKRGRSRVDLSLSREEMGNAKLGQGGVISPPPVFIGVIHSQTFFACLQRTLDLLNLQLFRSASLQLQEVHMLAG